MARFLPAFLSSAEVAELRVIIDSTTTGWKPGRQHTGYEILPLRAQMPRESPLVARALAQIGTPFEEFWDVYFIRYLDGACAPPHTDAAKHGRTHRRINAVIAPAIHGGELIVEGARIDLAIGDAVLFSPCSELHEVTPVGGTRLLFSVGAWV